MSATLVVMSLIIGVLSCAFSWSYTKYRRTKKEQWLYAALLCLAVQVEVMKERDRRKSLG